MLNTLIDKVKSNQNSRLTALLGLTPFVVVLLFSLLILLITLKVNIFRYNNFDYGKFDLGNMTQMVWYTAIKGKMLYLTDYFGTNLPRWAMSHVDPILLLFVPLFYIFPSPLMLVISQLVLILSSASIIYLIALQRLGSKLGAMFFGLAFLFYPALGFILAWTGFHGVSAVIPFFLAAFYLLEKMHFEANYSKWRLVCFWIFLTLTMMGKEQLSLYTVVLGFFVAVYREKLKLGLSMILVGSIWFMIAFFVIIPANAHHRIEGYEQFAKSLSIDSSVTNNVVKPNYFLTRYEVFGDSYLEIAGNMLLNPNMLVDVLFGGDKLENLTMTLEPLGYMPVAYLPLFVVSFPDLLINYATSQDGIGTSEIYNHRISMIIPVLFIASIYGIYGLSKTLNKHFRLKTQHTVVFLSVYILISCMSTSYHYQNPVYMWFIQAVQKRIPALVAFAKSEPSISRSEDLVVGDVLKLSPLENKDLECARKIVDTMPDEASISGPDYLGAHLSMRETYAIFPALYDQADYVIVDVFSQKVLRILDIDRALVNDVVGRMIKSEDYQLSLACGNLFVFKNIGPHNKSQLLPLQERFVYPKTTSMEMFQGLNIVEYDFPKELSRGVNTPAQIVYTKINDDALDDYFLFMTFVNEETAEVYQVANLPSFGILEPKDWVEGRYYIENIELALPQRLDPGEYRYFVGMSNRIRTRSIYLGNVLVQ